MDPSYNPFNGSQNVPGGAPAAPVVPGGASVMPAAPVAPVAPMPISSGTGDIMLTGTGETKSKKPLVIVGILALLTAAICGAVALFLLNGPKKTAEEEYADIESTVGEYIEDVYDVNSYLTRKYERGDDFLEFYSECADGDINQYRTRIKEFGEKAAKFSYKKISDDDTALVKSFVEEYAPSYSSMIEGIFSKLSSFCDALTNNSGVEDFLTENGLNSSVKTFFATGLQYIEKQSQYREKCADNLQPGCQELLVQLNSLSTVLDENGSVKSVFRVLISDDQIAQMKSFKTNINKVRNSVYHQVNRDKNQELQEEVKDEEEEE